MTLFYRMVLIIGVIMFAGTTRHVQAQESPPHQAPSSFVLEGIAFQLEPGSAAVRNEAFAPLELPGTVVEGFAVQTPETRSRLTSITDDAAIDERDLPAVGSYENRLVPHDPYKAPRTGWTRDLVALEVAFQVANALDAVTTDRCVRKASCKELNPLFGKRPSSGVIYGAKAAAGLIHYFAIDMLSDASTSTARTIAWITTVFQTGVVGVNVSRTF